MKKRIYISGPMTGYENFNHPAFNKTESYLKSLNYRVINPAKIKQRDPGNWGACMKKDLKKMLKCSVIFLLPGWEKSEGAVIEKELAEKLGFKRETRMQEDKNGNK